MAEKPHYSTLLEKDPVLAEEMSDNDMMYLLKSGGGAGRDRRLGLGEFFSWLLGKLDFLLPSGIENAPGQAPAFKFDKKSYILHDNLDMTAQSVFTAKKEPAFYKGEIYTFVRGSAPFVPDLTYCTSYYSDNRIQKCKVPLGLGNFVPAGTPDDLNAVIDFSYTENPSEQIRSTNNAQIMYIGFIANKHVFSPPLNRGMSYA